MFRQQEALEEEECNVQFYNEPKDAKTIRFWFLCEAQWEST